MLGVLGAARRLPRLLFCRAPEAQARWIIRIVPRDSDALFPVLDVEWSHRYKTCRRRLHGAQLRCEAQRFINVIERHFGKKPVVWTTVGFWKETEIGCLPIAQFWPRSVAGRAFGTACLAQRF